jgi:hypothetical protein
MCARKLSRRNARSETNIREFTMKRRDAIIEELH